MFDKHILDLLGEKKKLTNQKNIKCFNCLMWCFSCFDDTSTSIDDILTLHVDFSPYMLTF